MPFILDNLFLILIVLAAASVGFFLSRAFPSRVPAPRRYDLSDASIARIIHEARRAYRQSLGVFTMRSWNNLEPSQRDREVDRINRLRSTSRCVPAEGTNLEVALLCAIVNLATRNPD